MDTNFQQIWFEVGLTNSNKDKGDDS